MTNPRPPSEIRIIVRFSRCPGWKGYDISSEATTTKHSGELIRLPSATDCTYSENPFSSGGISVSVWPVPLVETT